MGCLQIKAEEQKKEMGEGRREERETEEKRNSTLP